MNRFNDPQDDPAARVTAIPPAGFDGSAIDWALELKRQGLLAQGAPLSAYADLKITEEEWFSVLEACES